MKKFCALMSIALCAASLRAADQSTVKTRNGSLAGARGLDESITVFRGIPYAAPPVGVLRWAPPMPAAAWQGTRDATKFGANCPQNIVTERKPWTHEFMAHGDTSEDCLYLNVWTAALDAPERRPVYVYLHGGGFSEGSGSVAVYDGVGLARKGLVVVTINYPRRTRLSRASGADQGIGESRIGKLRPARSDCRAAVGARQHRRVRR